MCTRNSGLFSPHFWNMIAASLFLATFGVCGLAELPAPVFGSDSVSSESDGQRSIRLTRGFDPLDVARTVQRNVSPEPVGTAIAIPGPARGESQGLPVRGGSVLPVEGDLAPQVATDQTYPAIAFDGINYLVVWQDSRNGAYTDMYGARVTPSGALLDSSGIAISMASNHQSLPAIAFDGTNYLVVWQDYRSSSYYDVYAARVTTSGLVLDPGGIPISTASNYQGPPAVAFDGTNYMVAWGDFRTYSYDAYVARVSKSGVVLDPSGIPVSAATGDENYLAIVFDGTNYLVVWRDERNGAYTDIYGARVSTSGIVLDPDGIAISTAPGHQYAPAVAFDGTNYMVVWYDEHTGSYYDVYCARVTTSGVLLDPTGIAVSTGPNYQGYPAIAFDGIDYVVVWQDFRTGTYDVYGCRVATNGAVLDPAGIPISTAASYQGFPAIAFDGTNCMVVWQDNRKGSYDIYAARLDRTGVVLDPAGFTDIAFASASAVVENGCVQLSWQMAFDVPSTSFLIRRSYSPDGEFLPVNLPVFSRAGLSFSCADCGVSPGKTYWYSLVLVGPAGEESYGPLEVHVDATPVAYRMYQSYPNPFNPMCTIRFEIPEAGRVSLKVLDVNGAVVRTLVDEWKESGIYSAIWDGRGDDGIGLPSGIYLYEIEARGFMETHKAVLLI